MSARATLAALAPRPLPSTLLDELERLYATPPRAYHTLDHVAEVAHAYDDVARDTGWRDPHAVFAAVLFHDAVYVPGAADNEARSADTAAAALGAWWPEADAARVAELVRLTARHGRLESAHVDADEARFLDCDMAILGAAPADYDRYEAAIAREHAHLDAALYRAGRLAFLDALLAAPRVFLSERFHLRLDAAARENLRRARRALDCGA